jgi:hypothetical protein
MKSKMGKYDIFFDDNTFDEERPKELREDYDILEEEIIEEVNEIETNPEIDLGTMS